MMRIEMDGRKMYTMQEAHRYLKEQFNLPDYYGSNPDALYDCLTEKGEQMYVIFRYKQAMLNALGAYGQTLLDVLRDTATENPSFILVEQ